MEIEERRRARREFVLNTYTFNALVGNGIPIVQDVNIEAEKEEINQKIENLRIMTKSN